mgnify:CR=1 FL=1
MLKAYIEQIIPCAYTILGIESFIIFSMCFRHPKALVSAMPALIAFWNIGMCTGYRADNGKLYLANANKLYIALYVFTCVYIYYVASDVSKHAMVWVVLHTLLGFLVDPIIYHYIARDIEQEA